MTDEQNKKLAELLFPNVKHTVDFYLKNSKPRNLPEGAFVTRLGPSPTGKLHIGQFYQCVLNSFLAKQTEGVFYLRVEDTDVKREKKGVSETFYPYITDLGLKIDEGYVSENKETGNYGPYKQSDRKEIYQTFVKNLIERGLAYPCFCQGNADCVDKQAAEEQKKLGLPLGYYGKWAKCRNLSFDQVKKNVDAGMPFTIRIKADGDLNKKFVFHDLRLGDIVFPRNYNDMIILKSNGQALYHLGHLVDDTLMHTTHVIRGEDWLPSAPLHVQLFEYFDRKPPNYLHTANLMTVDKTTGNPRKISKRKGDDWASCEWFFSKGYFNEAIIEYMLNLINSSFEPWRMKNPDNSVYSYKIDLNNLSKSCAMFDLAKLDNISKNLISKMEGKDVFEKVFDWAKKYNAEFAQILDKDKAYAIKVFSMDRNPSRPRKDIACWSEIPEFYSYMFSDLFRNVNYDFDSKQNKKDAADALMRYSKSFKINPTVEEWFADLKVVAGQCGFATDNKAFKQNPENFKGNVASFATIIRVAVTGRQQTPDLFEIMKTLGYAEIQKRFEIAIKFLSK